MKTEYCYAMVDLNGACWKIVDRTTEKVALSDLLAEGWRPIRETPFAHYDASSSSYILICLEREPGGQVGFGFGH
jgi:hypothetical protein